MSLRSCGLRAGTLMQDTRGWLAAPGALGTFITTLR